MRKCIPGNDLSKWEGSDSESSHSGKGWSTDRSTALPFQVCPSYPMVKAQPSVENLIAPYLCWQHGKIPFCYPHGICKALYKNLYQVIALSLNVYILKVVFTWVLVAVPPVNLLVQLFKIYLSPSNVRFLLYLTWIQKCQKWGNFYSSPLGQWNNIFLIGQYNRMWGGKVPPCQVFLCHAFKYLICIYYVPWILCIKFMLLIL